MIIPKRTTLGELYKNNAVLKVPKYQRAFDWGKSEVFEMMTDLKSAVGTDSPLFLGTFVFDTSEHEVLKIVDGQQRITSYTLLLIACRQLAKKLEYHSLAQEIQKKISFTDETTGEMLSERVQVSSSVADVFKHMCDEDWDGEFPARLDGKAVKRQSNKLRALYSYMYDEIEEFGKDELSAFLKTVYTTYVIQIDIEDELEAFDIFERTNARGLSLNVADLLKNYLYANAEESYIDERWQEVTKNAGTLLQRMLKYYWVAHHGYVAKKDLYRKLKAHGSSEGTEQLTEGIYEFSLYFNALVECEKEKVHDWLKLAGCKKLAENQGYLERITASIQGLDHFRVTQHIPLVFAVTKCYGQSDMGEKETKLYLQLIENIEKYHFVNNQVCERVGNEIEKPYAEFCVHFEKSTDFIATAKDFIALLKDKLATEEEFISRFKEIDYLSISLADSCYMFDRINNQDMQPSEWLQIFNPEKGILQKHYNTEHFLSQRPDFEVSEEDMSAVNSIGNLFVISRHTNSRLQNKPPVEKIKLLKDRGKKFRYVMNFVDEFEKSDGVWGKVQIDERAEALAKDAYRNAWKLS